MQHHTSDVQYRMSKYCSCQSYVRHRILCCIRHRTFFGRHRTYNVRYRQKTYDIECFLPVLASRTYYIVYDIVCFFTMSHTMCKATLVLYDIERKVPMSLATSPKTYDMLLRRRIQYSSIRYAIRSIRYACLGRRQARRDVLAMPLQLPRARSPAS
jgi:hypothetical protein